MSVDAVNHQRGFTLIEVLVALAIVGFGLIAVFGQLNQSATAAARLRDKTFAHWIAMNVLTERRLLRQLPSIGTESDDIEMANTRWRYEIRYSETGIEGLRRADVTVSLAADRARPLATAIGFMAERPSASAAGLGGADWRPIDARAPAGQNGNPVVPGQPNEADE